MSRPDGEVSLLSATDFSATSFGPFDLSLRCYGIYGMIELLAGKYLIVVTEQSLIGSLPGSDAEIRQVTGVKIIPCGRGLKELSPPLQEDEKIYLSLLESALNQSAPMASGLFYSPTVALSRSLQTQFLEPLKIEEWKLKAVEGKDEFVVNATHLKNFASIPSDQLSEFICCCIQGCKKLKKLGLILINNISLLYFVVVEVRDLVVNQSKITFALISRRNVSRTGNTKYV